MLKNKKFNYKKFASYLRNEAEKNLPAYIARTYKTLFLDTVYKFSLLAGKSLSNDEEITNHDDISLITQLISEWTFRKYTILLRSGIPFIYHEFILQKIAFTIYEISKQSLCMGLSHQEICDLTEVHVEKALKNACKGLCERGIITEEVLNNTLNLPDAVENEFEDCETPLIKYTDNKHDAFKYHSIAFIVGLFSLMVNIVFGDFKYLNFLNIAVIIVLSVYIGVFLIYAELRGR